MMILNRYAAALLSIAVIVLTAFVAIPESELNPVTIGQLAILALGAVVTYLVPLLERRWAGVLKTGAAVLAALVAAIVPFIVQGGITPLQVAVVILAALNALAVEVGVEIRKSSTLASAGITAVAPVAGTLTDVAVASAVSEHV